MQLHTRNPASVSLSASNQLLLAVHDPSAGGSTHPFDVIMPEFGPQTDGSLNPRRRKRKQESVNRFDPMDSKEPLELPSSLFRMQGLGDGQVSDDPVISPTVANKHKDIFKERTSIRKVNKNKKILHEHEILGIEPYRVKLLGGIRNLPEEMYRKEKEESEKLRMMVAALQNQLEVLLDFAARGTTKSCGNCLLIKERLEEMLKENVADKPEDIFGVVAKDASIVAGKQCLSEDAGDFRSSIHCHCNGKKATIDDHLEKIRIPVPSHSQNELISALISLTEPVERDDSSKKDDTTVEEESDVECHLCIDLASQIDEMDNQMGNEKSEDVRNEECVSIELPTEYNMNELDGTLVRDEEVEKTVFEDVTTKATKITDLHVLQEEIGDVRRGEADGYIDFKCGCTSQRFGDTVGILRLYQNGMVEIYCQCSECKKGKPMTPSTFEKHGGRGASRKWRETIWVILGDQKVIFSKVKGLDGFGQQSKKSRIKAGQLHATKPVYHRDEFVQCKKCFKKRRFRCRNKEECYLYHKVSLDPDWECSNHPFDRFLSCQDEEEREARQANRGCLRSRTCKGCISCVCLGCTTCRFEYCSCQTCREFIANN